MAKLVVIGAGLMGLAAAWHASQAGHEVTVLEADGIPGGMAAHFDFSGLSIERFYHFICKTDYATFDLMAELGIADRLRWRDTSMGYFIGGRLFRWGDPIALLTFPLLGLVDKFRYGWQVFRASKRSDWSGLHSVNVRDWIVGEAGETVWNTLWARSFQLKFYEYTDHVAAPWLGVRIKRLAASRKSIFQEQLGYIEGGSEVLVKALAAGIEAKGGKILCGQQVRQVEVADGKLSGVSTSSEYFAADHVISTVPTPYISQLVPDLPDDLKAKYDAIKNIGAVCVILKLKKSVSPYFWVNINDPAIEVPGIVEFSQLRPMGNEHIVYVPFYMPQGNAKFGREDSQFIVDSIAAVRKVNPAIAESDILDASVGRLQYAQPVCEPGFPRMLPSIQTPIAGLQIADTSFYYPEDRGISESVRLAKKWLVL
ncbi:MAG: NAD(P)/FAD-dependent oxidoreductase [Candidatus Methylumidiphilus sp.]